MSTPTGHARHSWASGTTCSSACSWHSSCSSPLGVGTHTRLWDSPGTHSHLWGNRGTHTPMWANPGSQPWPALGMDETPWSLPHHLGGDDAGAGLEESPWSLPHHLSAGGTLRPQDTTTAVVVRAARARRPSVLAALLSLDSPGPGLSLTPILGAYATDPPAAPSLTLTAPSSFFSGYYEDDLPPAPGPSKASGNGCEGEVCGDLEGGGMSAMVLAVPTKLEALVKFLAQSLHLVLTTVCSRKARRKDRDNPAALEQEHKLYLEEAVLERKIPETDLRQLVELPPGLGYEEWLASHTIDFFQHINLLYGTVCEYCTLSGCPDMTGPTTRQYLWFDEKGKKTRVAAPQYVDYVMTFTQKTINDESIFPTKFENDFPVSFESIVKKIQRLLFHVVAHIYHSHFREMVLLNLHAHLNCIFAHFILFNERFGLIDEKETEILHDLVVALKLHPESEQSDATTTATTTITTTTSSTTSCSQIVGLDCSGSPAASSGDTSTAINTLSSEREGGTCPSSEDQESSSVTDTAAVTMDSSSGVMASTEDSSAGATAPLLPDTGAVPDTRP